MSLIFTQVVYCCASAHDNKETFKCRCTRESAEERADLLSVMGRPLTRQACLGLGAEHQPLGYQTGLEGVGGRGVRGHSRHSSDPGHTHSQRGRGGVRGGS